MRAVTDNTEMSASANRNTDNFEDRIILLIMMWENDFNEKLFCITKVIRLLVFHLLIYGM